MLEAIASSEIFRYLMVAAGSLGGFLFFKFFYDQRIRSRERASIKEEIDRANSERREEIFEASEEAEESLDVLSHLSTLSFDDIERMRREKGRIDIREIIADALRKKMQGKK